jgi:hypothetical protein
MDQVAGGNGDGLKEFSDALEAEVDAATEAAEDAVGEVS